MIFLCLTATRLNLFGQRNNSIGSTSTLRTIYSSPATEQITIQLSFPLPFSFFPCPFSLLNLQQKTSNPKQSSNIIKSLASASLQKTVLKIEVTLLALVESGSLLHLHPVPTSISLSSSESTRRQSKRHNVPLQHPFSLFVPPSPANWILQLPYSGSRYPERRQREGPCPQSSS